MTVIIDEFMVATNSKALYRKLLDDLKTKYTVKL